MNPTKTDVAQQFSRQAHEYAKSASHSAGADLSIVLQLLQPHEEMRVLDIATGAGHTALAVAPFVSEVVATDLVPAMIWQTNKLITERGLSNVSTAVMDAEALAFPDESFDAVTCRIAPHHFENPALAVAEVARVLKSGGVFILEDNIAPQAPKYDRFINTVERLRDPSHVRSYTLSEWRKMLWDAGFAVTKRVRYRKTHNIAEWIRMSGIDQAAAQEVYDAFRTSAPAVQKRFAVTFDGERASTFDDEKVILRAVKK